MPGIVVLEGGYRLFFLLAGLWSFTVMGISALVYSGFIPFPGAWDIVTWHGHEMLFGYVMAAIAGFLLTAIPNWTGRPAIKGLALALLGLLWALGRLALLSGAWISPIVLVILVMAFPITLLGLVLRELLAAGNKRNFPIAGAIAVLAVASLLIQLDPILGQGLRDLGLRLGVATIACLITLIGGRIIPNFTGNWLKARGDQSLPVSFSAYDKTVLFVSLAVLLLWSFYPYSRVSGALLILLGGMQGFRLARWQALSCLREPLLFVLHVGYSWLVVGFILLGSDILLEGALGASTGLHALTAGAMGTMTLGVMSRAILGHSGYELTADAITTASFLFVTLAGILRVAAGLWLTLEPFLLLLAAMAWLLAFACFLFRYGALVLKA